MACPKITILLMPCGWLLLCGYYSTLGAEVPTRLPSVLQIHASDPIASGTAEEPAESPLPAPVSHVSYISQPEYTESFPGFAGPVPVENLVEYALANNPEVRAAVSHARSLGAKVPQVASLPDPQLTTVSFLQAIQTAAGPQEAVVSLSQLFPWFGKLPLRSQVAYHNALAAYAQAAGVELGVTERVKLAYYDVYFLQQAIEVNLALKPWLQRVVALAEARLGVGQAERVNLNQVRIELSLLKARLIELRQTKIEAQARLAAVLHLPPQMRIDAVARFDPTKVAHTARLLVDLAESYRPELDARRREYSRDRASVALAYREYWPDVMLGLNWQEIGSRGLSPLANGEDAYSLAVGVNLPLYRKRLDAAVREAQYKTARSAHQYQATLDEVHREVVAQHTQFKRHHQVLEILGAEIVPDAEETLELSIEAYGVGKLPFEQLIRNYRRLLDYQIDYYKREALREQAIASLERAVGRAVTAWPSQAVADSEPPLAPVPRPVR